MTPLTFSSLFVHGKLIILASIAPLNQWYTIALCFFFKTPEVTVVFKTTDILSPNIYFGPSNAIQNDRRIYLTSRVSSFEILKATNAEP
jgi:hypothetical protein